jgi:hypothetical protein
MLGVVCVDLSVGLGGLHCWLEEAAVLNNQQVGSHRTWSSLQHRSIAGCPHRHVLRDSPHTVCTYLIL